MGVCIYRQMRDDGRGCTYFGAGYCHNPLAPYYRCIDYIASVSADKFIISYSQIRSWDRCPKKWEHEQILGLRMREHYQSVNLRMGKEIQRIISGSSDIPTYFSAYEQINLEIIALYLEIIEERELLPKDGVIWEQELTREGFHGILDARFTPEKFGEIKFTGSPDFYLNNSIAWDQLEGYFYTDPQLKWGFMLPIRMPALKDKIDEPMEDKLKRIRLDINKRFNFYFPFYKADRIPPKWGRAFAVNEFDLEGFEKKFNWTKNEIKISCAANYFVHRRANCMTPWQCDFFSLCEGRNVNWELYEKKEMKGGEKENVEAT